MKVQKIEHAATAQGLNDWGTAGQPGSEQVSLTGLQYVIPGEERIDTGVFECTPGTYRRAVKQAEVMHFLAGSGSFTPDGESAIAFCSGDTLFFEANTEGQWVIETTMRKIYVIL